jgi:hypothetical protein
MPETFPIRASDIRPVENQILHGPGFGGPAEPDERMKKILADALLAFDELTRPMAIIAPATIPEFKTIYSSPVQDQTPTPVSRIFSKAEFIYLFAVTIGAGIEDRINKLFDAHDFALGYTLDAAASCGTENAAQYVVDHVFDLPVKDKPKDRSARVLDYNPGYCGWHMSGQRKLLDFLQADRIGIKLNDSYLMQPLKSLSGALIGGRPGTHEFDDDFSFCGECVSRACRGRIERVRGEFRSKNENSRHKAEAR